MIATYNNHVIQAYQEGGGWLTLINGESSGLPPAGYKRVAIRRAIESLQEQERKQELLKLKEIMP